VDAADAAAGDGRDDERRMEHAVVRGLAGVAGGAGHLERRLEARRGPGFGRGHAAPPTSSSARRTLRRRSSSLNPLWLSGRAPSPARLAAARKASSLAPAPTSAASAAPSRHGLVPTPPAARRAAAITPSSTCSAAATETTANSNEARSRTLR